MQSSEHLAEMFLHPNHVATVSNQFEKIFVANEIESGESSSFSLQILSESLLNLAEKIGESLEGLLKIWNVQNIHNKRRLGDFLHQGQELRVDILKPRGLNRQKLLDIGVAGKYSFEIDPLALHIDPNVKSDVDSVQSVLPMHS